MALASLESGYIATCASTLSGYLVDRWGVYVHVFWTEELNLPSLNPLPRIRTRLCTSIRLPLTHTSPRSQNTATDRRQTQRQRTPHWRPHGGYDQLSLRLSLASNYAFFFFLFRKSISVLSCHHGVKISMLKCVWILQCLYHTENCFLYGFNMSYSFEDNNNENCIQVIWTVKSRE